MIKTLIFVVLILSSDVLAFSRKHELTLKATTSLDRVNSKQRQKHILDFVFGLHLPNFVCTNPDVKDFAAGIYKDICIPFDYGVTSSSKKTIEAAEKVKAFQEFSLRVKGILKKQASVLSGKKKSWIAGSLKILAGMEAYWTQEDVMEEKTRDNTAIVFSTSATDPTETLKLADIFSADDIPASFKKDITDMVSEDYHEAKCIRNKEASCFHCLTSCDTEREVMLSILTIIGNAFHCLNSLFESCAAFTSTRSRPMCLSYIADAAVKPLEAFADQIMVAKSCGRKVVAISCLAVLTIAVAVGAPYLAAATITDASEKSVYDKFVGQAYSEMYSKTKENIGGVLAAKAKDELIKSKVVSEDSMILAQIMVATTEQDDKLTEQSDKLDTLTEKVDDISQKLGEADLGSSRSSSIDSQEFFDANQ